MPKDSLIDAPQFGITHPTIMLNPPTSLIAAQIHEWEPRVQIAVVEAPQGEDMTLARMG